jgi:hypothetical protein
MGKLRPWKGKPMPYTASSSRTGSPAGRTGTYLDQGPHVGEVGVHSTPVGEVLGHPLHELREAAEGQGLWGAAQDKGQLHPCPDRGSHRDGLEPSALCPQQMGQMDRWTDREGPGFP